MKRLFLQIKIYLSSLEVTRRLRKVVSPIFIVMLAASFVLWYIAKLGYSYTTELKVRIEIESQTFDTRCVVEGLGTNLFGYKIKGRRRIKIPLSELRYEVCDSVVNVTSSSLNSAIAVRFSDIKVTPLDEGVCLQISDEVIEAVEKAESRR